MAAGRGNQVKILNDPVTVTEERILDVPLCILHEKGRRNTDSEVRKPALYGEVKLPCKV
jgi:hypothetical protein